MKFYRIEASEKINNGGEIVSGDNVDSAKRRGKKSAFNLAEKWLKRDDVLSVWITEYQDTNGQFNEDDDPTNAWVKYEHHKTFEQHGGW